MIVYVTYMLERVPNCLKEQYARSELKVFTNKEEVKKMIKKVEEMYLHTEIGEIPAINFFRIEEHNTVTQEWKIIPSSKFEEMQ